MNFILIIVVVVVDDVDVAAAAVAVGGGGGGGGGSSGGGAAAAAAKVNDSARSPEYSVTSGIRRRTMQKFHWELPNGKLQATARKPSSYKVLFCE